MWKGSSGSPSGMVGHFNAAECPSGWALADGTGDTPDLRGVFVRGYGSQSVNHGIYGGTVHASGNLGEIQGDAIRNIQGEINAVWENNIARVATGPFSTTRLSGGVNEAQGSGSTGELRWHFNASRVVPVDAENRPVNVAMLACIKS